MKQYQNLIRHILDNGADVEDRTGIGSRSVFGYQMRFNLQEGFPIVTTKFVPFKAVVAELLWFLEGSDNERRLAELTHRAPRYELQGKNTIWTANYQEQGAALGYTDPDRYPVGYLGPIYGAQWRSFGGYGGIDQISDVIHRLKTEPSTRRAIVSAWDANHLNDMALPPCHVMFQFRLYNNKLSCLMFQRSADAPLGVPFNIASYALLTHIIAREIGADVGELVHTIGDAHIYYNQLDSIKEVLNREPYPLPTLHISENFKMILDFDSDGEYPLDVVDMFSLENYRFHKKIIMPMAV